ECHSRGRCLFSFLLLLELLDLLPLVVDLLLLRIDLRLGLFVGVLLILERISYRVTTNATDRAANRSAGAWRTHRRTNDRSRAGAERGTAERTFLTRGQWLPGTCADKQKSRQSEHASGDFILTHVEALRHSIQFPTAT